jgi:hypothetical protein
MHVQSSCFILDPREVQVNGPVAPNAITALIAGMVWNGSRVSAMAEHLSHANRLHTFLKSTLQYC